MTEINNDNLSEAEKCRVERNREHALQLRLSQVVANDRQDVHTILPLPKSSTKLADSGGFIPDTELDEQRQRAQQYEKDEELSDNDLGSQPLITAKRRRKCKKLSNSDRPLESINPTPNTSVPIPPDVEKIFCDHCKRVLTDSFLYRNFEVMVCDQCREPKGIHTLITKSTAKERYLLNDVDLDVREPKLNYLLKRNPHNSNWGNMCLYLEAQVAERALEIWGSEEALENERQKRLVRAQATKLKSYNKRIRELKIETRSSLFVKTHKNHEHTFGDEHYDPKLDSYYRSCTVCNYKSIFEKL